MFTPPRACRAGRVCFDGDEIMITYTLSNMTTPSVPGIYVCYANGEAINIPIAAMGLISIRADMEAYARANANADEKQQLLPIANTRQPVYVNVSVSNRASVHRRAFYSHTSSRVHQYIPSTTTQPGYDPSRLHIYSNENVRKI